MKTGVGFFNKKASEQYKSLPHGEREKLASFSCNTATRVTADTTTTAAKKIKVIHKKVSSLTYSSLLCCFK